MTSEEKNEKNRVRKRLERARRLREWALSECSHQKFLVYDRRVKRIEATLRGYE